MPLDEKRLLDHIGRIYEASLRPDRWSNLLEGLCRDIGADCGVLHIRDKNSLFPLVSADAGVDPEGIAVYQRYFYRCDLWARQLPRTKEGDVLLGTQMASAEVMERSEFLNDFLLRYAGPHALVGVPIRSDRIESNFTFVRSVSHDPFEMEAVQYLCYLIPHVANAVRVGLKLGNARSVADALKVLSKSETIGVIAIDYSGTVSFMSTVAERILRMNDGLSSDGSGVCAMRGSENTALRKLVSEALAISNGLSYAAGTTLTISRPSQRWPYVVSVSPIRGEEDCTEFRLPGAVIIIRDPDLEIIPPVKILQQLFGLTPQEARLSAKLFETTSLRKAAAQLKLTEASSRQYLKRVFAKTDTHNQAALMKLLSRLATGSGKRVAAASRTFECHRHR